MKAFEKLKIAVAGLKTLASLNDVEANKTLMVTHSYEAFDEPCSVRLARQLLREMGVAFEVKVKP